MAIGRKGRRAQSHLARTHPVRYCTLGRIYRDLIHTGVALLDSSLYRRTCDTALAWGNSISSCDARLEMWWVSPAASLRVGREYRAR